jgi:hypothetical protein
MQEIRRRMGNSMADQTTRLRLYLRSAGRKWATGKLFIRVTTITLTYSMHAFNFGNGKTVRPL